jgi:hypothetical protein
VDNNFSRVENKIENKNNVKTAADYTRYIKQNRDDIIIHFMKVYFYYKYKDKDGLDNPDWTFSHWTGEVLDYFRFSSYPNLDTRTLDSEASLDELHTALTKNLDRDELIRNFRNKMSNEASVRLHKLPIISEHELRTKWGAFYVLYLKFLNDLLRQVKFRQKDLDVRKAVNYIHAAAKAGTTNQRKLEKAVVRYKEFSFLEDGLLELCREYNLNL